MFIEGNRLVERWATLPSSCFVIGEIGFGAGVNFLLAWSVWNRIAPAGARLHFISCEKHPLSLTDLQQCLALWPELDVYAAALLDAYPVLTPGYHRLVFDEGRVTLDLMLGDALNCYQDRLLCGDLKLEQTLRRDHVDAWFLNDLSFNKNSDMWLGSLCSTLFQLSTQGTTLSSSSVEDMVKQAFRSAGFIVHKQSGYGKKREMLYGSVADEAMSAQHYPSARKPKTPWHVAPRQQIKHQKAIVIGAGLAGCFTAYALAQRGWQVHLLDKQSTVGQGASGNRHSILFPNLSAYRAPLTELMLSSFLYASRLYQQFIKRWPLGNFSGILQLMSKQKSAQTQADLAAWLLAYPELGEYVDATTASDRIGIDISTEGIFIPMAGWLDMPALCERLIQHPGIQFFPNTAIQSFEKDRSENWQVAAHVAPVVVIASGYAANQLSQTRDLDIQLLRGQMTTIQASQKSRELLIPLCGEGHILPHTNGIHAIGATFSKDFYDVECSSKDDDENYAKITKLAAELNLSKTVVSHWMGIRGAALDHMPFVGPVADEQVFLKTFASLSGDANRWIPSGGNYHNGLYIATGFGARGLTTIPLCAEYLAGLINHEPSCLPQGMVQAMSPARFLHRNILRAHG